MRAVILTADLDIASLIALELSAHFECDRMHECENARGYELIVCDLDTAAPPVYMDGRLVTFSRAEGKGMLPRPFLISDMISLCLCRGERSITLDCEREIVVIDGVTHTLTHREFLLFEALLSANGETVPCERLLSLAFDGSTDKNLLGVYIHYLRNKLERERRFIYSQRKEGYYLDLEGYTVC